MQPTLYDGDRLLVAHGAAPRPGGLVVVRLPDGVVAVKRAHHREPNGAVPDERVVARVLLPVWPLRRGAWRAMSRPPYPP
jgi:signal peptidase I